MQGIAVIFLSLVLLLRPFGTILLLTLFLGLYLFVYSFVELFHALFGKNVDNRLWLSVKAFIAFLAGVLLLMNPLFGATGLPDLVLYLIAFVFIFMGGVRIFIKPQDMAHRHFSTILLGILELLLGLALLLIPAVSDLMILVYVAAILGVVMGMTMIIDSFRLRKLKNAIF